MRLVRRAWAFPGTLVGRLLALTFDARRWENGILVAEGARWPRRLGWRYRAITLGRVVLVTDRADEALMAHEAVHVGQWERWGPLFFIAYPVASLLAVLRGGHHYRDNAFEAAASRGPEDVM